MAITCTEMLLVAWKVSRDTGLVIITFGLNIDFKMKYISWNLAIFYLNYYTKKGVVLKHLFHYYTGTWLLSFCTIIIINQKVAAVGNIHTRLDFFGNLYNTEVNRQVNCRTGRQNALSKQFSWFQIVLLDNVETVLQFPVHYFIHFTVIRHFTRQDLYGHNNCIKKVKK